LAGIGFVILIDFGSLLIGCARFVQQEISNSWLQAGSVDSDFTFADYPATWA
jgi:hypothetical protein